MDIINVELYGGKGLFGGKETPLEADIISCDKYKNCSFFANGHCLRVRSFGGGCQFGRVSTVKGYTRRAKKYGEFKSEWKNHEKYSILKSPPQKLGLIDEIVMYPYPHATIKRMESGELTIGDPLLFGNGLKFIPYEEFTVDFIYKLCAYKPQAVMGGEIETYQKETVPLFLSHLEEVFPERYCELIDMYPSLTTKMDYVGRKAYLKTVEPSLVVHKSRQYPNLNNEWMWDGEYLRYKSGYVSSFSVVNEYEIAEITLKPTDQTVVKITNNEQVTKKTVFVD